MYNAYIDIIYPVYTNVKVEMKIYFYDRFLALILIKFRRLIIKNYVERIIFVFFFVD